MVFAITDQDVAWFIESRNAGSAVAGISGDGARNAERARGTFPGYSPARVSQLQQTPGYQATGNAYEQLNLSPVESLLNWMLEPEPHHRRSVANAIPAFFHSPEKAVLLDEGVPLKQGAASALDPAGHPHQATLLANRPVSIWRQGPLAVAMEAKSAPGGQSIQFEIAMVLDDRPTALAREDFAEAWQLWLRISNAMAGRSQPTVITTLTILAEEAADYARTKPGRDNTAQAPDQVDIAEQAAELSTPEALAAAMVALPRQWQSALEQCVSHAERALIAELGRAMPSAIPPEVGAEICDGIPVTFAWAEPKLAVLVDLTERDHDDLDALADAGWTVLAGNATQITAELKSIGG